MSSIPKTQAEWRSALDALPPTAESIPSFFFAHGSPTLEMGETGGPRDILLKNLGANGQLAKFLKDFGPALLQKYKPKGIVVFSAHWDTAGERLVTDYGDENPLLYDYYGFDPQLYELKFKSKGDTGLSQRVVQLFKEANYQARTSNVSEPRGMDGRGFQGPGLDHGVFIPFRKMFGENFMEIPVVEVSIDSSLNPEANWNIGKAIAALRREGILVLSGGLIIHNLRDFASFSPDTARPLQKEFDQAVLDAVLKTDQEDRRKALIDLTKHRGFRSAHSTREDHFVPLYVAAGAAEEGQVRILNGEYGIHTFAFGV